MSSFNAGPATVYGIVKQNNGFIGVHSEPATGTTFKIRLPRCTATTEWTGAESPSALDVRGNEIILLVEDEPLMLKLATTMLERHGYTALCASTPREAIRLVEQHAGEIHLLMTDVVMPEMNGRDLVRTLMSSHPHLKQLTQKLFNGVHGRLWAPRHKALGAGL